jgi:hypothetical protein
VSTSKYVRQQGTVIRYNLPGSLACLLTRTAGRGLRPAADYQARIDGWLRPL